jgi:hypothetical protein
MEFSTTLLREVRKALAARKWCFLGAPKKAKQSCMVVSKRQPRISVDESRDQPSSKLSRHLVAKTKAQRAQGGLVLDARHPTHFMGCQHRILLAKRLLPACRFPAKICLRAQR